MNTTMHDAAASAPRFRPDDVQFVPTPLIRPLEPSEPFPIEALGPVLQPAAEAIQRKTQAPLGLVAQSVLAAATYAVQAHGNVVLPYGEPVPISGFFLTIAKSGERKTAVDRIATKAISERQKELAQVDANQLFSFAAESAAYDAAKKHVLTDKKRFSTKEHVQEALKDLGPAPEPPLTSVLLASEPTFEALVKCFHGGQPSLGIFSAEGAQFVGGHAMSEDNRLKTSAALSSLWDGEPIRRNRAGDGSFALYGRRLSLHLMMQPGVAAEMLSSGDLLDQGFLSRCLLTFPTSTIGTRLYRDASPEDEAAIAKFAELLRGILRRDFPLAEDTRNELEPPSLAMDADARRIWIAHHDHVEPQQAAGQSLEGITGFASKAGEHAARLAGMLALMAGRSRVSGHDMGHGVKLADYYTSEAVRMFSQSMIAPEVRDAEDLRQWLETRPEMKIVSVTQIVQRGPNRFRVAKAVRQICGILVDHGYLTPIEGGAVHEGRMQSEVFSVWRK
jgi:hypothetical protein